MWYKRLTCCISNIEEWSLHKQITFMTKFCVSYRYFVLGHTQHCSEATLGPKWGNCAVRGGLNLGLLHAKHVIYPSEQSVSPATFLQILRAVEVERIMGEIKPFKIIIFHAALMANWNVDLKGCVSLFLVTAVITECYQLWQSSVWSQFYI